MTHPLAWFDAGPMHARRAASVRGKRRILAAELCYAGLLRKLPASARFPARYVVTARGSHALGTFDSC